MIALQGFPILNQLANNPAPSDGQHDENASFNCVPTCLAMCIRYFDSKLVAPDDLKDIIYGQGHVGGGDEQEYKRLLASRYGLALGFDPKPSGSLAITDGIRAYLRRGIPSIVTMQSDWAMLWGHARFQGWHVGVAYAISETDDGVLHIANPWRGFDHVRPVREWAACLGIGVWPVSKTGGVSMFGRKNSDGSMSFAAGKIGVGFADLYSATGEQGDLSIPETYFNDHESFCRFTSGHVFRYDAHTGQASVDTSGLVVDGLYSAWMAAKQQPQVTKPDPVAQSALVALQQLKSALGNL